MFFPPPSGHVERVQFLPLNYFAIDQTIADLKPIVAVIPVCSPVHGAWFASGLAIDFSETALRSAAIRVTLVNPLKPELRSPPRWPPGIFTHIVETYDRPLEIQEAAPDAVSVAIASRIATLIEDGATIQIGIGKIPTQVLPQLTDRRHLRLHSGIVPQGVRSLLEAGALRSDDPAVCASIVGDRGFFMIG